MSRELHHFSLDSSLAPLHSNNVELCDGPAKRSPLEASALPQRRECMIFFVIVPGSVVCHLRREVLHVLLQSPHLLGASVLRSSCFALPPMRHSKHNPTETKAAQIGLSARV